MKTADTSGAATATANERGRDLAAIFTDLMLAERHADVDRLYRAEYAYGTEQPDAELGSPVGPRLLAAFVARAQAAQNYHYATRFSTLTPPVVSVDKSKRGQRFLRIIATDNWNAAQSRRVLGFLEVSTGRLWKANTFKAPATNYSRGDVRDLAPTWGLAGNSIG